MASNIRLWGPVSEETEGQDTGAEASGAGVDPAAVALALGGASREDAGAFLKKQSILADAQTRLATLQAQELSHELGLRHWSLWVRHVSGLLKLGLEVSAGLLLLAVLGGIGIMVWSAAHADGLVIESFSVPPDIAARGLTGQVVAEEILDGLTEIQTATVSSRTGRAYAGSWGDDIKVEIPETGISIGEAYRFLRRWLGHESHVSGSVWREQGDIVITVHTEDKSVTVKGTGKRFRRPVAQGGRRRLQSGGTLSLRRLSDEPWPRRGRNCGLPRHDYRRLTRGPRLGLCRARPHSRRQRPD